MIEPALLDRLTAVYANWLDEDDLGERYVEVCTPEPDAGATSVRQFLQSLLRASAGPDARIERPAALEHPDSTFMQLLGSPLIMQAGRRGLVESVARHALCLQAIPRPLLEASGKRRQRTFGVQARAPSERQGKAVERDVFARGIDDPTDRADLADSTMKVLEARLGRRTIGSFFTVEVASNGYRLWDPRRRAS